MPRLRLRCLWWESRGGSGSEFSVAREEGGLAGLWRKGGGLLVPRVDSLSLPPLFYGGGGLCVFRGGGGLA